MSEIFTLTAHFDKVLMAAAFQPLVVSNHLHSDQSLLKAASKKLKLHRVLSADEVAESPLKPSIMEKRCAGKSVTYARVWMIG